MSFDGYDIFLKRFKISPDELIDFGLSNIYSCSEELAAQEWESLKHSLKNGDEVFIRRYGRNIKSNQLIEFFYQQLFPMAKITADPTNNSAPRKKIEEWTKKMKNPSKKKLDGGFQKIRNFQVSHVFGQTKNPLLFQAPFNIIYLPKIMDPFTGHEASGEINELFIVKLHHYIVQKYYPIILDFNNIRDEIVKNNFQKAMNKTKEKFKNSDHNVDTFEKNMLREWNKIEPFGQKLVKKAG